jgi:hypothetical protein
MHLGNRGDDTSSIEQIRSEIRTEEIDVGNTDEDDNCSACDRYHLCNDHPGAVSVVHADNRYSDDVSTTVDVISDDDHIIVVTADVERGDYI